MALKCVTDISHLGEEELKSVHERILDSFIMAGENFVAQAREQVQDHALGTYIDQTTNLRNSIGYLIFLNGERVHGDAGQVEDMNEILERVDPNGYQLIGYAGMNYASYVETKGYNVITAQSEQCIINLNNYLSKFGLADKDFNDLLQESFVANGGDYEEGL